MCKPKPGPRCYAHVNKEIASKAKQVENLETQYKIMSDKVYVLLREGKRDDANALDEKRKEMQKEVAKKQVELKHLNQVLDTTPKQYNAYLTQAERLEEEFEKTGKKNWNLKTEAGQLRQKAERGKQIHEQQMILHHAIVVRSKNVLGYKLCADATQEEYDAVVKEVGAENLFPGRISSPKDDDAYRREQLAVQGRVDTLTKFYSDKDGKYNCSTFLVNEYSRLGLTPGYKLVGLGTQRAVYQDIKTGRIIKIPLMEENNRVSARRTRDSYDKEQYSYAVVDLESLAQSDVEYLETSFYVSKNNVPTVVQPNLDMDKYEAVEDEEAFGLSTQLEGYVPGIWDVHMGNMLRNKETKKIVLFDCLQS